MDSNGKGIIWFVFYCLMFTILSAITKHLLLKFNIFEIIFIQTSVGSFILLPIILRKFKTPADNKTLLLHATRSFFWVAATAMYFYAITKINLPKAVAVSFAVPLFTTILAVIFLKEKIHLQRILALIFGIIGMMMIVQPGLGAYEQATLWVIFASFLWSITDIIMKITGRSRHAISETFYFAVFSALFSLPLAMSNWQTPNMDDLKWLLLLAAIFCISITSLSKAYQNADLTVIMPFTFLKLIFVAVVSYFIFDEVITINTSLGTIVIISSTSYIAYRERKARKKLNSLTK